MSSGKLLRSRRVIDPGSQSTLMFAFSHGTSSPEVLPGIEDCLGSVEAAGRCRLHRAPLARLEARMAVGVDRVPIGIGGSDS
jgi:hypothetical protein